MKQALTPILIVVGTGPHSELVAKLNDLTDYIELGDFRGEAAAIIPEGDNGTDLAELMDVIEGEGWEIYAVSELRAVEHYLATGEAAGYVGELRSHAQGDIVFGGNRFRISKV